jgi:carboxymethylenebutenolidase
MSKVDGGVALTAKQVEHAAGVGEGTFVARPATGPGPGVLVLHAWWGLTPFMRSYCDRLAGKGFVAMAPDLYHGATAATIEEAEKLRGRLKRETAVREIAQAAEQLQVLGAGRPGIGVVGFSLGGYYALWQAEQASWPARATVVFYGSRAGEYGASRSAFQFHLAATDPYVPASGVKKMQKGLAAAGREAEYHIYPGTGHWFFESDRPDAYEPRAAELAWERLVLFLKKHLG